MVGLKIPLAVGIALVALLSRHVVAETPVATPINDCGGGLTTTEQIDCFAKALTSAELDLTRAYKGAMMSIAARSELETATRENWKLALREAQRSWISFRDNDCGRPISYEWHNGSGAVAAAAVCRLTLLRARTADLRKRYLGLDEKLDRPNKTDGISVVPQIGRSIGQAQSVPKTAPSITQPLVPPSAPSSVSSPRPAITSGQGWQYASWGAAPGEVIAASGGIAQRNEDRSKDPSPYKAKLTAAYSAAGIAFRAYFQFDVADHLAMVDLEVTNVTFCSDLVFQLTSRYGPPEERGSFDLMKWWDRKSGNVVIYSRIDQCQVRYLPIEPAGKSGGL